MHLEWSTKGVLAAGICCRPHRKVKFLTGWRMGGHLPINFDNFKHQPYLKQKTLPFTNSSKFYFFTLQSVLWLLHLHLLYFWGLIFLFSWTKMFGSLVELVYWLSRRLSLFCSLAIGSLIILECFAPFYITGLLKRTKWLKTPACFKCCDHICSNKEGTNFELSRWEPKDV